MSAYQSHPTLKPMKFAATPFELKEVRVTGGPLKAAQDADAKYLLELNPDGFLNPYHRAAGLKPKAPFYGGWESRYEGYAGEILGHYLTAVSQAWAVTGDARFKEKVDYVVDEMATCQNPNGAIYADPKQPAAWEAVSRGEIKDDNPVINGCCTWYRVHKNMAGLLDAYKLVGNKKALQVALKYGNWACEVTKNLTEEEWQYMLEVEFGGANEGFAELAARTGDPKHLELARHFYHRAVCDPLAEGRDALAGLHANTQIPKVAGEARIYELTADPKEREIAEFFWQTVVRRHSYAIGGNSQDEHFGLPDQYINALADNDCETCNTYNMEKLTRYLFKWHPKSEYADWYERALFNHILGSQDPETGMMCYFSPLESGHVRKFSTPFDSFWCCVGTGMENHMLHGSAIYYKDGSKRLWVNLFIPSEVSWNENGMKIKQETSFPLDGSVSLRILSGSPHHFTLSIRKPHWVNHAVQVEVNGSKADAHLGEDGYLTIGREWKAGDEVRVVFPMSLRIEKTPGNASIVSLAYGPLVLSADMDEPLDGAKSDDKPMLTVKNRPIDEWLKRTPGPGLKFQSVNAAKPSDYVFRPFAELRHQRTATYFEFIRESE